MNNGKTILFLSALVMYCSCLTAMIKRTENEQSIRYEYTPTGAAAWKIKDRYFFEKQCLFQHETIDEDAPYGCHGEDERCVRFQEYEKRYGIQENERQASELSKQSSVSQEGILWLIKSWFSR